MYRVLIISENFRHYCESYKRCFEANKCEVLLHISFADLEMRNYFMRMKKKLGFDIEKFLENKRNKESETVWKVFLEYKPDIVFVMKGTQINENTVKMMSRSAITILYMWDTIVQFPALLNIVEAYDIVYSFIMDDVQLLREKNIKATHLAGGFDEEEYYPLNTEKIIDVSFVGAMYPFRRKILSQLVKDLPSVNFVFYGEYAKLRHPIRYIKWFFGKENRVFKNMNILPKQVNDLYNKSKICLNLQLDTISSGWNSRLDEILGTKSFQIVNQNPVIKDKFEGCLAVYSDYEDLKNKILFYLQHENDRNIIASNGYKRVKEKYTRTKLIEKVLQDVEAFKKSR